MSNNQRGKGNYGRGRQGRGRGSSMGCNPHNGVHGVYGTTPQGGDMPRNPTRGGRPYFRGSSNSNMPEYRDQITFANSPQSDDYARNTNRGGRPYFRGGRGSHIGHDIAYRGRGVSNRGMGISNTSGGPNAGRNNESCYYQGNEGQMPISMPREQMRSPYYNNTYTQSPPMNMMPGQEEVTTTHTVRRYVNTQVPQPSQLVPQPSHFIQPPSHLIQPPTHLVPPPTLITRQQQRSGNPAHNMMNRSQSEMNIPMHDINPSQRQRMHKQESNRRGSRSSSNNNLARSSSLQTIEKGWDDTGARPKDFKHMRGNRRNEHNQERPISAQQKGSAMINKSQEMLEDTSDNEQELGNKRNANYRYRGRARGQRRERKGHLVNNYNVDEMNTDEKTGRASETVCNEAQDFEANVNEIPTDGHKERNRISRCKRSFKRHGAKGKGNVEKIEQSRDVEEKTKLNDKIGLERDSKTTTCEKVSERMSVGNRRSLRYNESVHAKGNHYNGRNYNRLRRNIERKRCTDSESSVISGTSTVTDTDQLSKTDPVRAGVDGIDEISIQTLKNRKVRYKKKLNELKKTADPNQIEINELETTLEKLQLAIHSRVVKEKETTHQIESNKGKDTSESCMINIDNENEMDIKYRDDKKDKNQKVQQDRKHKFVATSKKTVVFRPKSKRASNFVTGRIKRNSSDGIEIDSSDSDAYEDIDIVEEMPKTGLLGDKQTIKTNTVRNRSKGKHNSGGDWQTTLDDLCELDANIGSDSPFEIKIKEVKANNDVNIDSMEKKGRNKLNLGTATKEASCKSVVANKFSEGNLQNIGDSHIQNRKRSGSERSDSSVDIGPEEVEIFKYLVREMNGEGNPLTIKNKSGLFKSCNDMNGWFRKHSRKFNIFEKDNTIVNISVFVKDAEYCLDYITRNGCTKSECNRYHICKNLLCGDCKFGDHCKFSHDCLDTNNLPISTQLGFVGIFDNEQIISILSRRFPHVCENWNKTGSCEESSCSKLHLCQRHVFGNCLAGDVCPFEHTLSTTQNLMVTKAYRMSNWNPKIFNKLVFVPRTSTQFRRDVAESMKSYELDKESTKDKSGTNQRKPDVIDSRKSKVAQKRLERNTQFEDKNGKIL